MQNIYIIPKNLIINLRIDIKTPKNSERYTQTLTVKIESFEGHNTCVRPLFVNNSVVNLFIIDLFIKLMRN